MFKKLFGSSQTGTYKPKNADSNSEFINVIHQLDEKAEAYDKRREALSLKIADAVKRARACLNNKDQRGAKLWIQRKKMLERQQAELDTQMLRLIEQKEALEQQNTTLQTVTSIHNAAAASQRMAAAMKADKIDKMLDFVNEQNEKMRDVQDSLAQPIGLGMDIDEDEIDRELEELGAEELDHQLLEPAAAAATAAGPSRVAPLPPRAPVSAPPSKTAEELELEQLEAELAA